MFHHVKELQFNARVTAPDPRFAGILLEQFGGPNGELKAAMQYFVQAFLVRKPYPDKYDLLMDVASEEFSHLEIVGATITMLLDGINGELKNAAESSDLMGMLDGKSKRDDIIHNAFLVNPQFLVLTGGGPRLTDSMGNPWSGTYVNANGDLTVDLRSNIAAESRAKIVYEYLLKFTDDPLVRESLEFLMTREVAHAQMFEAALATIQPNFPQGILQSDPRYSNLYFNMSNDAGVRGPWNEGKSIELQEEWIYIEDPLEHVMETEGLTKTKPQGTQRTATEVNELDKRMSKLRSQEVKKANAKDGKQWSEYPLKTTKGVRKRSK